MGLRICIKCGKREMVRKDKPAPKCLQCRIGETTKKIVEKRRSENLCLRCGGKRDSKFLACERCRNKYKKRQKNYNARKKNAG